MKNSYQESWRSFFMDIITQNLPAQPNQEKNPRINSLQSLTAYHIFLVQVKIYEPAAQRSDYQSAFPIIAKGNQGIP
jgi:hypothetical protein